MIKSLLLLQFPLMYCPILVIGLVVYGSDFKYLTGYVYLGAMALITLLHISRYYWLQYLTYKANIMMMLLAVISGSVGYYDLHLMFWDEHNLRQAILISVLGVCSYVASLYAACLLNSYSDDIKPSKRPFEVSKSLVLIAIVWLVSIAYPMMALLFIVICMALALVWFEGMPVVLDRSVKGQFAYRFLIFVFSLDMALVIWDYKVNAIWGAYLCLSMLAVAVGIKVGSGQRKNIIQACYFFGALNLVLCVLFPQFVLSYIHSAIAGLAIGVCVGRSQASGDIKQQLHEAINLWPPVFLALVIGYALSAQLTVAHWRILLVIPLVFIIIRSYHIKKEI